MVLLLLYLCLFEGSLAWKMLLYLLALYFFRRAEERAFYEHTQFMKKYLSENPCLTVKKNKRR